MKSVPFGKSGIQVPAIAVGCMRIGGLDRQGLNSFIHTAVDNGAYFFDHADIYGAGASELNFGNALKGDSSIKREDLFLQSKASIRPGICYDCSKEHILEAVDGILERLQTTYLDSLLIHRPDALIEPQEVAEAFDILESSGKVRYFGVSNHKPMQIELLKRYVKQPLQVNQLQFSIPVSNMIAQGMEVNMDSAGSFDHDGSVLDYSRLNDMTIQAWSPFQQANWQGPFIGSAKFEKLNQVLNELAEKYHCTPTTLAAAWILRHPAKMQVVTGTAKEERLVEIIKACDINLSREDWYRIYLTDHPLP